MENEWIDPSKAYLAYMWERLFLSDCFSPRLRTLAIP